MTESREEGPPGGGVEDQEQPEVGHKEEAGEDAFPGGDPDRGPDVGPGIGGFEGRDPKTDMPKMPTAPETQGEPERHGGAPDPDKEPPGSY